MTILELFRSALISLAKEADDRGVPAFLRTVFEEYQRALPTLTGELGDMEYALHREPVEPIEEVAGAA